MVTCLSGASRMSQPLAEALPLCTPLYTLLLGSQQLSMALCVLCMSAACLPTGASAPPREQGPGPAESPLSVAQDGQRTTTGPHIIANTWLVRVQGTDEYKMNAALNRCCGASGAVLLSTTPVQPAVSLPIPRALP